jgi:uncharacterized nucleotidyltransferase DUF6036
MHRRELQHVIFEVGRRFNLKEVFIIGSAAILAAMPEPPEGALTMTRDVDIIPPGDDDERMADQISFVLGEASAFDEEYGYHAQGVSFKTPTYAPHGWQTRTIDVRIDAYVACCMEPNDLVLSKLGAGREKDLDFAQAAAKLNLVDHQILLERLKMVQTTEEHTGLIARRIAALFK